MQLSILGRSTIAQSEFSRCRRAGDGRDIFCSRTPLILVRATEHDRLEGQSTAEKKKSGTFRSIKFVCGEARGIDQRHIDVDFAE